MGLSIFFSNNRRTAFEIQQKTKQKNHIKNDSFAKRLTNNFKQLNLDVHKNSTMGTETLVKRAIKRFQNFNRAPRQKTGREGKSTALSKFWKWASQKLLHKNEV